mgnify:CR=1 FL=1
MVADEEFRFHKLLITLRLVFSGLHPDDRRHKMLVIREGGTVGGKCSVASQREDTLGVLQAAVRSRIRSRRRYKSNN